MTILESWGRGKPDYYKPVISSRPQIITESATQIKWTQTTAYVVNAQGVAINNFYTIPAGYNLELGGGFISCKDSCINKLRLLASNTELVGDFRFDTQGVIMFSSTTGQQIAPSTTIIAYIYNNDTLTSDFSLTISGVLTKE